MTLTFKPQTLTALAVGLLFCPLALKAKAVPTSSDAAAAYQKALSYIASFQLDSAEVLLAGILQKLGNEGRLSTPFGMRARLKEAEVMEKQDYDEAAVKMLLLVASASLEAADYEVYANAQLSLARLHEKQERAESCFQALEKAKQAMESHQLTALYPRFSVRMASYHRIFGQREEALWYARAAMKAAMGEGELEMSGNAHMLMGMLLKKEDLAAAAVHFSEAADAFLALKNQVGYTAMFCNLASLYKEHGQYEAALKYTDAYIKAHAARQPKGSADEWMLSSCYEIRSDIMAGLGLHDSAHHYLQMAFDSRLKLIEEENRLQVVEIEAQFYDQQKAQKIEEQARLLRYESNKQQLAAILIGVSFVFAGVFFFLYFKLRGANRQLGLQAALIKSKNRSLNINLAQQVMLHGEIHHRVKNNLQIIISLLELHQEEIEDVQTRRRLESMSNRIYSMAAVHEMLYSKNGGTLLSFKAYSEKLLGHFQQLAPLDQRLAFCLDISSQPLNVETLMPLGIVMNELITNSMKYAAAPGRLLEVGIRFEPCADGYCLAYRDNGPGYPEGAFTEKEGSLGLYLVKSMVRQLNGKMSTGNDNGACCSIFIKEKYEITSRNERTADSYR